MKWIVRRARRAGGESGFTLIEMLVAAAMSVVIVGAASSMLISAVRDQPKLSKRAQSISTARWVLERMTREIRTGITIESITPSSVTFKAYVRHTSCGSGTLRQSTEPSIVCQITYSCTSTSCSRQEGTAAPVTLFSGIGSENVFNWTPNTEPTFVGVTLRFPNAEGEGALTISDGAGLRGVDPLGAS